jgi:ubiquitin carboxyl-terminal hydrolase 4/11
MPLTRYLLAGKHVKEINRDNPLGMNGLIAERYAELLGYLWSGDYSSVSPTAFKATLGRFAPQFSGFQQQDSQELLAFLLDGLHEDLNRVIKKPPVPQVVADGRSDAVVATESWEGHLLRNRSVIVELFQGQFKSTVVCPTEGCGRVSITFDPFMYLSAPLPIKTTRMVEVTFVPLESKAPNMRVMVKVEKTASVLGLKEELGKLVERPANALLVCDIYGGRVFSVLDDHKSVSYVRTTDKIYVYEVLPPQPATEEREAVNYYYVQVVNRRSDTVMLYGGAQTRHKLFSYPVILSVAKGTVSCAAVHALVRELVEQRYLKEPLAEDDELPFDACIARNHTMVTEVHMIRDDEVIFSCKERQESIVIDWNPDGPAQMDNERIAATVDHPSMEQTLTKARTSILLQDCVELFTNTEKLGEQDAWYCNCCKDHVLATKKFDLWKLPEVLVVHLKRFQYTRHWREKINTLVEFPLRGLDMSEFVIDQEVCRENCIYDLFAVSNHSGGLGGGHYTAYTLDEESGRWYDCNDAWVSEAGEAGVVSTSAYLLFYRRRAASEVDAASAARVDPSGEIGNDEQEQEAANEETPAEVNEHTEEKQGKQEEEEEEKEKKEKLAQEEPQSVTAVADEETADSA